MSMKSRRSTRFVFAGLAILVTSAALLGASRPAAPIVGTRTAGFFDSTYESEQGVQHLGVDIAAKENLDVRSPVDGTIVSNNTWNSDVNLAYLVIKSADGEHVLGHIASTLAAGKAVKRNQVVGKVRPWPGNSHVHWGINTKGVAQAISGKWGWGRAPRNATVAEAKSKGWVSF